MSSALITQLSKMDNQKMKEIHDLGFDKVKRLTEMLDSVSGDDRDALLDKIERLQKKYTHVTTAMIKRNLVVPANVNSIVDVSLLRGF